MKTHVVDELRSKGLSAAEAERQFNQVADAMATVIERGNRVRIPNVGTLARKSRAETKRRNPRTGESITIAAHDVVAIRSPRKF